MAKKSTLLKDIGQLNEADLQARIKQEQDRYAKIKHMHTMTPLENPVVLRRLRKDIARMLHTLHIKKQTAK